MELELKNHPAIADHPTKPGQKLYDADGVGIPLFPDERSVWLDGSMIGYVGPAPARGFNSLVPKSKLPEQLLDAVTKLVERELGTAPAKSCFAAEPIEEDLEDTDDFEFQEI